MTENIYNTIDSDLHDDEVTSPETQNDTRTYSFDIWCNPSRGSTPEFRPNIISSLRWLKS